MIRTRDDLKRYMEADKEMLEQGGASQPRGLRLEVRATASPIRVLAQPPKDAPFRPMGEGPLPAARPHGGQARLLHPAQCLRQRAQHRPRRAHRRQPACAHRHELQDPRGREHRNPNGRSR